MAGVTQSGTAAPGNGAPTNSGTTAENPLMGPLRTAADLGLASVTMAAEGATRAANIAAGALTIPIPFAGSMADLANFGLATVNMAVEGASRAATLAVGAIGASSLPLAGSVADIANAGVATVNLAAEGASRAANAAAGALSATQLPLADSAAGMIRRASDGMMPQGRNGGAATAGQGSDAAGGGVQAPANQRLADTVFEVAAKAAVLPLPAATAVAGAAYDNPMVQQTIDGTIQFLSGTLDRYCRRSIFPESAVRARNLKVRKAALQALFGGPTAAVLRDFNGVVGGLAAFFLGDPSKLAHGSRAFKSSMEYVFEKWLHGEVQPASDFPLKKELAEAAIEVVERFPEQFVQALDRGHAAEIASAYLAQMSDVNSFLLNYPRATFNVFTGVTKFVIGGIFVQIEDGYAYVLNELAIFGSRLSNEEKDWAHGELRKTAPTSIVGFEYYIPLLVDFEGNLAEKCYRRNAAGEIVNDRVGSPSIFPPRSIRLAQSIHAELSCLPSLIWLYGDETKGKEKNFEETSRKFGPAAAQRIADHPLFPMTPAEIAELTRSGPRTPQQVEETLDYVMRVRGLIAIADGIKRGSLEPVSLRRGDVVARHAH